MNEIKASLRRWASAGLVVLGLIGCGALYTWANSLKIPDLEKGSLDHNNRIIVLEERQRQILKNTEEIKVLVRSNSCPNLQ